MEEKKQIKISLKTAVLLVIILLIVVAIVAFLVLHNDNFKNNFLTLTNLENYKEVSVDGKIYYQRLTKNTWKGQYHQENFYTSDEIDDVMEVVSYTKYLETINSINSVISKKIKDYYSNKDCNYIILAHANGYSWCEMELIDCFEDNNKIIIYGDEEVNGVMADGSGFFIAIPTNMPVGTEIEYRECYSSSQINNLKKYDTHYKPSDISVDKPIIYLYPTEDTEVSVKLLKDEDIVEFLEEKLAILGLTEREAEEFIVYWLPKLESNKYNYIRFATLDEINKNMPLEVNPNPDTIIRVLMTFKGLENPINVQEQHLETPDRTGSVVVEWGGTEIE